jgi:hypothetical protein
MLRRSWLLVLPLVVGFLWLGGAPSQADGALFKPVSIHTVGCDTGDWSLTVRFSGQDNAGGYVAHTLVSSGGKVYMSENAGNNSNGDTAWGLGALSSYAPGSTNGTYPIPAGHPMKVVFNLERPIGNVLSSWTMVAKSCDTKTLLYNGLSADDGDGDYVNVYRDKCPDVRALTANGCPVGGRSLVLNGLGHPRSVVGQLVSPGFPQLSAGRVVTVWKVKSGPDKRVATRKTNGAGRFSVFVAPGKYYAKSAAVLIPTVGQASADTSRVVRVN